MDDGVEGTACIGSVFVLTSVRGLAKNRVVTVLLHMRRAFAASLLAGFLLTSAGPVGTFFFCAHMQETMRSACCGHDDEAPMSVEAGDCCEAFSVERLVMQPDSAQRSVSPALPPLATLPPLQPLLAETALLPPVGAFDIDATGPPVLAITQALRI